MNDKALFSETHQSFHAALLASVLRADAGGASSNANKHSRLIVSIVQ